MTSIQQEKQKNTATPQSYSHCKLENRVSELMENVNVGRLRRNEVFVNHPTSTDSIHQNSLTSKKPIKDQCVWT